MNSRTPLKDATKEPNQCDGCAADFTLDGDMHRWSNGMPYMFCTRELYERKDDERSENRN